MHTYNSLRRQPMNPFYMPIFSYPAFLLPIKYQQPLIPKIIPIKPIPKLAGNINEKKKSESIEEKLEKILSSSRSSIKKSIKKVSAFGQLKSRVRKNVTQIEELKKLANDESKITSDKIEEAAKRIGLKASQVYKWLWDHRKIK